jgi:hypothetical protein
VFSLSTLKELMGVSDNQARKYALEILNRDRSDLPIVDGDYTRDNVPDKERGEYHLADFSFRFDRHYQLYRRREPAN